MNDGPGSSNDRVFLVVVDDSEEMGVALRYACRRASNTGGRVALLFVVEPTDFQHWMAVGDLMREEARNEGEQLLQRLAARVNELTGTLPVLYVREGSRREELMKLIDEEPSISILVLGASIDKRGPGPLIEALTGKFVGKLRVPVTIVPGNLDEEDIDSIS
ncbi:MAG: universal stress protein [Rhodospirillales bacterium]|nr:universal stress protein [Rhodospirillales bacterium]MDH3791307.1 universal stress protein [Rhodospirillales bacterium]MDH3912373.1 universal stress protein [Rhodospirillales bacterium]MDH3917205.1 universal stress protein [Rhodospirillales bacterium]MDH3965440.1 universal stress protein [Rhodospirillales bacterium]